MERSKLFRYENESHLEDALLSFIALSVAEEVEEEQGKGDREQRLSRVRFDKD